MPMKMLQLQQGTPEWITARMRYFCASDAAAMLGFDKRTTRTELLRLKATGDEKEFSGWVQTNLLDKGHEIEAHVRAEIEGQNGTTFYPVTGTNGRLLASFDGVDLDDDGTIGLEVKSWNEALVAAVVAGDVPDSHWPQLEQQILVGELKSILFVVSNGNERKVTLKYRSKPERREQLRRGWLQFSEDLANYKHVEVLPPLTGTAIAKLPALAVTVTGEVTSSNLAIYKESALGFIRAINTELKTDQDFADAETAVKFCSQAEGDIDTVKRLALSQTKTIDELFSALDSLQEAMRAKRLTLEKLVDARKKTIRAEILAEGVDGLKAHIILLNQRLGKPYMPSVPSDFAGAMSKKRTIATLRDAEQTELARAKIAANAIADNIALNLIVLRSEAADYGALFPDAALIVLKAPDDFAALVKTRIAAHKEKEAARLEAERERIRKEEAAKLEREAAARKANADAAERQRVADAARTPAPALPANPAPAAIDTSLRGFGAGPRPAVSAAIKADVAPAKRPSDETIIAALADCFRVHESTVVAWLLEVDLTAAGKRLAEEFAA